MPQHEKWMEDTSSQDRQMGRRFYVAMETLGLPYLKGALRASSRQVEAPTILRHHCHSNDWSQKDPQPYQVVTRALKCTNPAADHSFHRVTVMALRRRL